MRMKEMIHTLSKMLFDVRIPIAEFTYNPPRANTAMRAKRCLKGMFRFFRTGMGKMMINKSVTTFKPYVMSEGGPVRIVLAYIQH